MNRRDPDRDACVCGKYMRGDRNYELAHSSAMCVDAPHDHMRYRSARAAGLSHADAEALAATTGPMFFTPKATTE